jgi:hypothetical protein|tara:strand:+ start:252 stop:548 length:297 start_codon:yes stop_codon:yes gene_type:complete
MAIYKNFSGDQTNAMLIQKNTGVSGRIDKILITNTHSSATQSTRVDLYDGTNTYILYNNIDIPSKTSLVLTDNISFDSSTYSLRLTTTGSSNCDIIIK